MAQALWLLLLLLGGRWARPGRAGPCGDGQSPRRPWGGHGTKCCPQCTWGTDVSPCDALDPDCKCPEGFGCANAGCDFCQRLPQCGPGWEPQKMGAVNFHFECRRCQNGSYSSSRNSPCRNWTDCGSLGLATLRAGNSSHNALCGAGGHPGTAPVPPCLPPSPLLPLLAGAVLLLALLSLLLHCCIRSLRGREKSPAAGSAPPLPRLPPPPEESSSIQFPEEEHGDKSEEKISSLSLKIYSELR